MKIIDWNININNNRVEELAETLFSSGVDIICLQEFPQRDLKKLEKYTEYIINTCVDQEDINRKNSMLTLTAVKKPLQIEKVLEFVYFDKSYSSFLKSFIYKGVFRRKEFDKALIVEITKDIAIVNFRLSTATGPMNRIEMLKNIFVYLKRYKKVVICGDFNSSSNLVFNFFTGIFRGYKLSEYFINERSELDTILKNYEMRNVFAAKKTISSKLLPKMQLDYIVVDNTSNIYSYNLGEDSFGSDHLPLFLDVDVT